MMLRRAIALVVCLGIAAPALAGQRKFSSGSLTLAGSSPALVASTQPKQLTLTGTFNSPLTVYLMAPGCSSTTCATSPPLDIYSASSIKFTATFATAGSWTVRVKWKSQLSNTLTVPVSTAPPPPPTLTITCPANQGPYVSSDGNAVLVTYPAPTTSGGSPPVVISSAPGSGVLFPVGTTTVNATATDSGSSPPANCSFTVTVTYTPPSSTTVSLTGDVLLTGSQNYILAGTASQRIALQCNGHSFIVPDGTWTGTFSLQYVDWSNCGSATVPAFGGTTAGQMAYVNGGAVLLDHVTLHTSGDIQPYTGPGACVSVTNSVFASDNVWPSGMNDQAVPGIFYERGSSTCAKVFQGNRLEKSWAWFESPNWLVGSRTCTAGDAPLTDFFIGERAGFGLMGTGSEAACNYTHSIIQVTPQRPYYADVENLRGPGAGASVHDNVFVGGQWMTTGIDGELHDNVYADALNSHDFWRIGAGGRAHHNILFGASIVGNAQRYGQGINYATVPGEAAAIDLVQSGNHLAVTHNTIDLTGQVEHGCARVVAGATLDAYQDNICVGVQLGSSVAALMPDPSEGLLSPPPARIGVADNNNTTFAGATLVYDLTTATGQPGVHDLGTVNGQGLDPRFRGPLPVAGPNDLAGDHSAAFPFNDADLLNGTYTVADVLAYARWVYAPAADSPLRFAASDGGDIGAVQIASLPTNAPAIVTTNKRPVVSAGPSFTTGASLFGGDVDHAELVGWGADDGLPSGVLTFQWTQTAGPATATIDFPTRSAATATLPACGDYTFQLAASDGVLSSTAQTTITKACTGTSTGTTPTGTTTGTTTGSGSTATPPPPSTTTTSAHPRLLDAARLALLQKKVAATDATWVAFKAHADALVGLSVAPYDPSACPSNAICYGYEGTGPNGWYDALTTLGLAYQLTRDTRYSAKALQVIDAMNAAGVTPETVDSGYPSRSVAAGLASAFDACYDQLGATRKAATIATLNAYYDWAKANAFDFGPASSATGNYFGGHLLGFGLAGLATAGDNSRASEITTYVRSLYDAIVAPAFATGVLQSGYPLEGYVYGTNHFVRLLQYMVAVKAATGEDLVGPNAAKIAHSLLYSLKPNRWQFPDEADYAGNYTGIMDPTLIAMLPTLMPAGAPDAGYAQWEYQHLAPNPAGISADPTALFQWYDPTLPAVDYRVPLSKSWYSPGDEHLFARSDWTDSAAWFSMRALNAAPAGHQLRGAGNVEVQRGNDYLVVNAGQWKGPQGWGGDPQAFDDSACRANTLTYQTSWSATYCGGQGWWGANATIAHSETPTYAYLIADLTSPYTNTIATGLKNFTRAFVSLQDGNAVVCDHIEPGAVIDAHKLVWHLNQQSAPVVNGNTVTATVGASTLQLVTFGGSVSLTRDTVSDTDLTPTTWRVEVTDPTTSPAWNVQTVLSAFAAGATPPVVTNPGTFSAQIGARTVSCSADARSVTVK